MNNYNANRDLSDIVIVIPARLKSQRLPNKLLLKIGNKTIIQHTYNCAINVLDKEQIFIATDSSSIYEECSKFTKNIIMTPESCLTGTDRLYEFSKIIEARRYINLQGDEPIMPIENISTILLRGTNDDEHVYNMMAKIDSEDEFYSLSVPKCVFNIYNELLYMSRSGLPGAKNGKFNFGFKQVCLYSFTKKHLEQFASCKNKTKFEEIEDIEILRFLEKEKKIKMVKTKKGTIAVDYPRDIKMVENLIKKNEKR